MNVGALSTSGNSPRSGMSTGSLRTEISSTIPFAKLRSASSRANRALPSAVCRSGDAKTIAGSSSTKSTISCLC